MKGNKFLTFILSCLLLPLVNCGGSGDGVAPVAPFNSISGNAVDAVITNGTIRAFAWDEGIKGELLATAPVDGQGFYDLSIQSTDRPILLEVSDGRYTEEASGVNVQMIESQIMSSVFYYTRGTDVSVQINPLTNMAMCYAKYKVSTGQNVQNAITAATSAFSALSGVDIIATFPLNVTDPANADFEVTDGLRFGALLAGISSFTAQTSIDNGVTPHRFNQNSSIYFAQVACQDILADGLLNGQGFVNNGSSIGQLALGTTTLTTNTYRLLIAQHILNIMSGDRNATGLGVSKFVQFANQYAQSTDAIFGSEIPQAVDQTGPVITGTTAQNAFLKGVVNLNFQVTDPLGVQSITFDVNGIYHSNGQSDNPVISLNTLSYSDGPITVKVTAVDVLNNASETTFTFNVDNTSPIVTLTSPVLTNTKTYLATGTYQPQGSAVASITANGVPAVLDTVNLTWSAQLALGSGSNTVSLVVTDDVANIGTNDVVVGVDLINPTISVNPQLATFTTFQGQLNLCTFGNLDNQSASSNPICVSTDNVSLNGAAINSGLASQGYAVISFIPVDSQGAGVFTSFNDLTVEYKYELNGVEKVAWAPVPTPPPGLASFTYYLPMVTEYLSSDWFKVTPNDNHKISIRVFDNAGNSSTVDWNIKTDVLIPSVTVTSNTTNSALITGTNFASRASVDGQLVNVEYLLDNQSNTSYFISLLDEQNHSVDIEIESKIRKNRARVAVEEKWLAQRCSYNSTSGCSGVTSESFPVSSINGQFSSSVFFPAATQYSTYQSVLSDNPSITDITGVPSLPATTYSCTPADFGGSTDDWIIGRWANGDRNFVVCVFDNGNNNQTRNYLVSTINKSIEFDTGYPRNETTNTITNIKMGTENITVFNDTLGQQILPVSTWYRIPPQTKIKIIKAIRTPLLLHKTDPEVAQPVFTNYASKSLDKSITWNIDTDLSITRAIDPGDVSLLPNVTQFTETFGNGIDVYLITR